MFVIGDVHGRLDLLKPLYDEISKYKEPIYSVGDLADRGPNGLECFKFVREHNINCVRGNHEEFLIDYFTDKSNPRLWMRNGGFPTVDAIMDLPEEEIKDLVKWIRSWPLCIINHQEKYIIYHAGPRRQFSLGMDIQNFMDKEIYDEYFLWNRQRYINNKSLDLIPYILISGHTPTPTLINSVDIVFNNINRYYIDTGAFATDTLSALRVVKGVVDPEGYYYNKKSGFYKKEIIKEEGVYYYG